MSAEDSRILDEICAEEKRKMGAARLAMLNGDYDEAINVLRPDYHKTEVLVGLCIARELKGIKEKL
jgi:hypothetical protein